MPVATYPGVTGVLSFDMTTSIGITPAIIGMTCYPDSVPEAFGDLAIGDGDSDPIDVPDCLLQYQETVVSKGDKVMVIRLLDRRWKWRDAYPIDGHYNQQDRNRKLIPWTVLSPYQLARLCLAALGEYAIDGSIPAGTIDLPGGLARASVIGVIPPRDVTNDQLVDPYQDYLRLGQNLTETKTNPVVAWQSTPAAVALANLVEQYGRAVVLDPIDNKVRIVKLGTGTELPEGGRIIQSDGNSTTGEPIPTELIARGNPTRYQPRLYCRPVGRDWDGNYYPHERLSYAPTRAGQKMQVRSVCGTYSALAAYGIKINGTQFTIAAGAQPDMFSVCDALKVLINASGLAGVVTATSNIVGPFLQVEGNVEGYEFTATRDGSTGSAQDWDLECWQGPITGVRDVQPVISLDFSAAGFAVGTTLSVTIDGTTVSVGPAVTGTLLADALSDLSDTANGDGAITLVATTAATGTKIVVTGITAGVAITATGASTTGTVTPTVESGTTFTPLGFEKSYGSFGWLASAVGGRLSYAEAKKLADETIYKCYQVMSVDPADPSQPGIPVPGYGTVDNRFRLILEGTRPETIVPRPGEAAVIDLKTGQPYAAETYNGYSVDRPNVAYGSVWIGTILARGLGWYRGTYFGNTQAKTYLPIQFSIIDPEKQIIQFAEPVYRILGKGSGYAAVASDVVIEVGVQVLEPTLSPARYSYSRATGGFGPEIVHVYPDIQQEVISEYNADHTVAGSHVLDADAENRAKYYTDKMAEVLQLPNGQTRRYGGILSIPIDGLVRQVRWAFEPGAGPSTTCSTNSEFSRVIVPYQTRRRLENMQQDSTRLMQNLLTDYRLRGALRAPQALYNAWRL
jgi:hypothetical protein